MKYPLVFGFLIVATTLEAFGDATVRIGLYNRSGASQIAVLRRRRRGFAVRLAG